MVAGVVYALAMPLVALTTSYVYFDARAREELFFDLVFVFAFTQVTDGVPARPDIVRLGHRLLILAVLWWASAS